MVAYVLSIAVTAIVTSALTLYGAWLAFDRVFRARLEAEIDARAEAFGQSLREHVSEGVRAGVSNSIADLRRKASLSGAARTGLDLFEDSINFWFGPSKRKK